MSFLERIRRFLSLAPEPDHPLSAEERDERSAFAGDEADDEKARVLESLAGGDFDPDDPTARP